MTALQHLREAIRLCIVDHLADIGEPDVKIRVNYESDSDSWSIIIDKESLVVWDTNKEPILKCIKNCWVLQRITGMKFIDFEDHKIKAVAKDVECENDH